MTDFFVRACPDCGGEFQDWVELCPDCEVPLEAGGGAPVPTPEPETPGPGEGEVVVRDAPLSWCRQLAERLVRRGVGSRVIVSDQTGCCGGDLAYAVCVAVEDLELAQQIDRQVMVEQIPDLDRVRTGRIDACPACGAPLGAIADACPDCGLEFPEWPDDESATAPGSEGRST